MQLRVEWMSSLPLGDGSAQNLIYKCDLEELPDTAGFYIFGRRHGIDIEALYVGKANSIRARVKQQLRNIPLMKHVQTAKTGGRTLLAGCFVAKRGQQQDTYLRIIERSLIRHFLLEGRDLVNVQGARRKQHEITSSGGRGPVPKLMFVDHSGQANSN